MKTIKYLAFMLALLVCNSTFISCSNDDDDEDSTIVTPETTSKIVGTWIERYESNSDMIEVTTFIFTTSGTGQMIYRIEDSKGVGVSADPNNFQYTYNEETEEIRLKFDGDPTLYNGKATITGTTLMLSFGGTYYSLSKQ